MNGLCTTIVVQLVPEILNLPPELKRRIWLENRPRRLVAVGAEPVEEVGFRYSEWSRFVFEVERGQKSFSDGIWQLLEPALMKYYDVIFLSTTKVPGENLVSWYLDRVPSSFLRKLW